MRCFLIGFLVAYWLLAAFGSSESATTPTNAPYPYISSHGRESLIHPSHKFQDCGGMLNATHGYFHTPNFPGPFPVPISCRWVIQAPPEGYHIVVYFTQMFLRKGVSATEYGSYSKTWGNHNPYVLGPINADRKSLYLVTSYPFLVIDLEVYDMTNVNIRVLHNLMDVYGFNATYELQPSTNLKRYCTAALCSYNGHCYVDKDYRNFNCHCFPNYTGDRCQYGPKCNPAKGLNVCKNGGNCSNVGSWGLSCECPAEFSGFLCEVPKTNPGKGLIRFHGSLKLQNASYIPSKFDNVKTSNAKKALIESQIRAVIGERVRNMRNLTVLSFKDGGIVEVHFFAYENESGIARNTWTKSVNESRFGTIAVSNTHLVFEQEPALSIQSLKVRHGDMVIVGNEMMLTCITYGSSNVSFNWFKDGVPVNHNFTRNNWDAVLPKSVDDKRTAIFTVGIVEEAHAGTYTCKVNDWGEVQERSVTVRVIGSPRVTVTPRTLTVEKGSSVSIICLAALISEKFGYTWAKNNKILESSEREMVEDIFPEGSRLKIASAETSARYSCVVSGTSKSTEVDSRIAVISSHVIQVCPQEEKFKILWSMAASNTQDLKPCPAGFRGDAVRDCITLNGKPYWEEPDFSQCISLAIADQQLKLDNMKLGFMLTTPMDVLVNLSNYLKSGDLSIYPGEGGPILNLLKDVMEYQRKTSIPISGNVASVFFDIVSRLLVNRRTINKEEQVLRLVRLVQETTLALSKQLRLNTSLRIDRKSLAMDIVRRTVVGHPRVYVVPRRFVEKDWYTNSVTVTLERNTISQIDNSTEEIAVISYSNLARFFPKRSSTKLNTGAYDVDVAYELMSHLVTVSYLGDGKEKSLAGTDGHVQIDFSLTPWETNQRGWNLSCGLSNLSVGRLTWSLDNCAIVVTDNSTNCRCTGFGTYAVLLTLVLNTNGEVVTAALDSVVAIGCFVGCVMVLLTLICLIVCWRVAFRGFVVMKVHVCVGLLGAMLTILVPSQFALPPNCYPYVSTLVEFFLLEPLTMHVCLELFLYLELANVHHIQNAITKITLLGWGIPTLVTGATVVVQAQEGFNFERWWMQVGDTYFFGFTISAVILFALYILLYLVVNLELRQSISIGSPHRITISKRMGLLRRSLIMQLAITAFALMNIVRGNYSSSWYRYTFAAVVGITGFLTFLLYTVKSESPGCICSSKDSSSSVKSSAEMSTRSTTTTSYHCLCSPAEVRGNDSQGHVHPPPPPPPPPPPSSSSSQQWPPYEFCESSWPSLPLRGDRLWRDSRFAQNDGDHKNRLQFCSFK